MRMRTQRIFKVPMLPSIETNDIPEGEQDMPASIETKLQRAWRTGDFVEAKRCLRADPPSDQEDRRRFERALQFDKAWFVVGGMSFILWLMSAWNSLGRS